MIPFVKNMLNARFRFLFSVNFIPLLNRTGDSVEEKSRSVKRRHICFIRFRSKQSGKLTRSTETVDIEYVTFYVYHIDRLSLDCVIAYRTQDGADFVHSFQR